MRSQSCRSLNVLHVISICFLFLLSLLPSLAGGAEFIFHDTDQDLLADLPADKSQWIDPEVLTFSIIQETDKKRYNELYKPIADRITELTGRKVEHLEFSSPAEQVLAMREGRLHIAGYSTGTTVFAVNLAGYIPVAARAKDEQVSGYHLQVITGSATSNFILPDLKGKRFAHSTPTSNSGNVAPRALLPSLGLTPEKDYEVLFSGSHNKSILGVASGVYDGAAIASSVLYRMLRNGAVNNKDIRILYTSPKFPTFSMGYVYNLHPDLAVKIGKVLSTYHFPAKFQKHFKGANSFTSISYKKDWEIVRFIAMTSGIQYTEETLQKMGKKKK